MNNDISVTRVLAPSDFGFLWAECKRCYYLKVVHNLRRPSAPFPAIFSKIDSAMKHRFAGDKWHSIGPSQPSFRVLHAEKMISSAPIILPGRGVRIIIRGKFDSVLRLRDSRIVVCDFKTAPIKPEHIDKYWVQLHAYGYALEHPCLGSLSVPRVHGFVIPVFEPGNFEHDANNGAALSGAMEWIEMPRDDNRFMSFLNEVASVLEQPEPPNAGNDCQFCRFRQAA